MSWNKLGDITFSVVDLETTGLSPHKDEILEVCIVRVKNGDILEIWKSLVRPNKRIPLSAIEIHGINNDMLMDAPEKTFLKPEIEKFLANTVLVEHSKNFFDSNFLIHFLGHKTWDAEVSTLQLARWLMPGLDKYDLESLCMRESITLEKHHSAEDDAIATANLFIKLVQRAEKEFLTIDELYLRIGIPRS